MADKTATPHEWARTWRVDAATLAAADALHGWALHVHHAGAPMQLTEDAFLEAISAVTDDPPVAAPSAESPHRYRRM